MKNCCLVLVVFSLILLISPTTVLSKDADTTTTATTTSTTTTRTTPVPVGCYNQFCTCVKENQVEKLECTGFNSYRDLEFANLSSVQFGRIVLKPNNLLELNDHLDLSSLYLTAGATLQLWSVKLFALDSRPFDKLWLPNGNKYLIYEFVKSTFRFDYHKSPVIPASCSPALLDPNEATLARLFPNANTIQWTQVDIPEPICVHLFSNLKITTFKWTNVAADSRIVFSNTTQLTDPADVKNDLNCSIRVYTIENSNIHAVDAISNVLSHQILSQTQTIEMTNSRVDQIRPDTFYYLSKLKELKLRPLDWPEFLYANWDVVWMNGLNSNVSINVSVPGEFSSHVALSVYLGSKNDSYDYPEEDFCYFAEFPHHRSLLPIVNFYHRGECTCTVLSILRYASAYKQHSTSDFVMSTGNQYCLGRNNSNQTIASCKIDDKIQTCRTSRPTKSPIVLTSIKNGGQGNSSVEKSTSNFFISLVWFYIYLVHFS